MLTNITDVNVQINLLQPTPVVGLGRPVIFVESAEQSYKEYRNLEEVRIDHPIGSTMHAKSLAIFAQANRPRVISVISYVVDGLILAAEKYFFKGWHFALLAEFNVQNALALSNFIEEQQFKFLVVQVPAASELAQLQGNTLTVGIVHNAEEHLDAALIGNVANLTVGSVTWKGRSNLAGITPSDLDIVELNAIHRAGGVAYVEKAGIPQTSEGKTLSGEFIDALHGDHWVKSAVESQIQGALTNSDKINFDASGIALLRAKLTDVLDEAHVNGIVDTDDESGLANYEIVALQRDGLNPDDISNRHYEGLSFTYQRSGAIHTVSVTGNIQQV